MPFFDHYPYTNFHNVNLDWVLQAVKSWGQMVEQNNQNFINLEAANQSFKEYVTNYLTNLDVQEEINNKLDDMLASGALTQYFAPYIQTDVSEWLEDHITPTTPPVDDTLTIPGAAADAKVTGDRLNAMHNTYLNNLPAVTGRALGIVKGSFATGGGSEIQSDIRARTDYIKVVKGCKIVCTADYPCYTLRAYDYSKNYLSAYSFTEWANGEYTINYDGYARLLIKTASGGTVSDADIVTFSNYFTITTTNSCDRTLTSEEVPASAAVTGDVLRSGLFNYPATLTQGTLNAAGTEEVGSNYRIRTDFIKIETKGLLNIKAVASNDHDIYKSVWYYNANREPINLGRFSLDNTFKIPDNAVFVRIILAFTLGITGQDTITPSQITSFNVGTIAGGNSYTLIHERDTYIVDNVFNKHYLDSIVIGRLTYTQAFCIYNNNYYSTDGSHIAVQDSSFSAVTSAPINVGHGNAMQAGVLYPNYAYISGWNDNKIYIVNLDTLTLVDTITLPTTGYTTAAIDDVNGLAYIFQRDTDPTLTEEHYNFIVYDYINDEVIMRRKTEISFAIMQACQYTKGHIIVVSGHSTVDNYYVIYDTSGNITSELKIPMLEDQEPEGVYADNESILISVSTGHVYKFTTA